MKRTALNNEIIQERFSSLIKNLHEAVLVENEERKIVLTNQAFCNMFGIQATTEQMIGADCANAAEESKVHFNQPEAFVARINEILAQKQLVIGDRLETVFGTYLERDYIPVFLDDKYMGHMWKYRDVTENQLLIRNIQSKNQELKDFSAMLSHDIKNPVRSIKSIITWIEDDLEDNNVELDFLTENLGQIKRKIEMANNIIDGVINYSRIGIENSLEEFSFKTVINEATTAFKNKNLQFDLQIDESEIEGVKTQWLQVFNNLISNAIKYNDKDVCIISITVSDGTITLSDNGPGVSADGQAKMFIAFETLDQNKNKTESTGIGLAIVKKVLDNHQYKIGIDNSSSAGLKYIFTRIVTI